MSSTLYQSTSTKTPSSVKPFCLGLVAAAALSSTLASAGDRLRNRQSLHLDFGPIAGTARIDFELGGYSTSDTSTRSFSHYDAVQLVSELLNESGFAPKVSSTTADGSMLFQQPGKKNAYVDLYPNGEMIVVVRNPEVDEIHELSFEDTDRMIQLLRDAPACA